MKKSSCADIDAASSWLPGQGISQLQAKNFQLALRQKPQHVICQQLDGNEFKIMCTSWRRGDSAPITPKALGTESLGRQTSVLISDIQ